MTLYSFAFGIGTKDSNNSWLEVFYPQPCLNPSEDYISPIASVLDYQGGNQVVEVNLEQINELLDLAGTRGDQPQIDFLAQFLHCKRPIVATFIETDSKPETVPEVYLKLHLLSHRIVKPHGTNLQGMFGLLANVAWTNKGAIAIDELAQRQLEARLQGELLEVMSVDKFPKMTNYVVPTGVRIAHTARVRLGAYIGEGTTVMHEGFVNFNAGTDGQAMIEGRISAGVVIASGTDLGGGCSTMGTLSGGGNEIISVGKDCLIGANAGLGFPLGDRCIIEAGLYMTAGTKVTVFDSENNVVEVISARLLSGHSDLVFRRNSITGTVECKTNKSKVELNHELHDNN